MMRPTFVRLSNHDVINLALVDSLVISRGAHSATLLRVDIRLAGRDGSTALAGPEAERFLAWLARREPGHPPIFEDGTPEWTYIDLTKEG